MGKKIYVLDSSAFIGGFYSNKTLNFTINDVFLEVKDLRSRSMLQSAVEGGYVKLMEPDPEDVHKVEEVISKSGDITRLSEVDKRIVALAFSLKKGGSDPIVITDDYSIQNVLKIVKIEFKSVLTPGIEGILNWIKICKGCKKKYPPDYRMKECEICGSPIYRKRR